MGEARTRHRLTLSEEKRIGVPPLVVAAISGFGVFINKHVHDFRNSDSLGNLNPADYVGSVWGSAFIGILAYSGAAVLERAHPKLERRAASIILATTCALGPGFAVNASWETERGAELVASHIPKDVPLIRTLNSDNHTPNTIDLAVGTSTSGLVAAMMAIQCQYYIRRREDKIDV